MIEKFYPNYYFNNVEDIPLNLIKEERIKAIIFDMDNTLVNYKYYHRKELKSWIKEMKKLSIKMCILSNTPKYNKVKTVAKELGLKYMYNACKPWSFGFKKAENMLEVNKDSILMVGDQLFTDILGGNMYGMKTILVNPIDKKEFILTKIKRPIERMILKKYLKSKKYKESEEKYK